MSEKQTEWMLEIEFPRPYDAVEVQHRGTQLVISIPFLSETSAQIAREELETNIRPRVRLISGEVIEGHRMISGEVVQGEQET